MFQTGLGASVFGQGGMGQGGGYTSQASKGTATWASPQGPQTATQAGFGTVAGDRGSASRVTHGVLSAGAISLGLLIFIWWSLPR
jgi:hypothetical protein